MTPDRASPARAAVLGLAAAALGVAAHGEAGGPVAVTGTAALVAVLVVLGTALAGAWSAAPAPTTGVLVTGQLALHLALPGAHSMAMTGPAGHHSAAHHAAGHPAGMLLAHVAVAVLVAGGLARADRALARAVRA